MPKSKIEWTDRTWNPTTGCTRVSAGCDNCYAASMTKRLAGMGQERYQGLINEGKGHFNGVMKCHADRLNQPFSVKKPSTFFVNSMSDLFHENVPFAFVDKVWTVMAHCPHHKFQILTKRPGRMRDYVKSRMVDLIDDRPVNEIVNRHEIAERERSRTYSATSPLPNVWLGTSIESQDVIDRIEPLLETPAAVRFLSCEPLLGPIDFDYRECPTHGKEFEAYDEDEYALSCTKCEDETSSRAYLQDIDQVIVGGESGPKSRPMHTEWARSIRDQCSDHGTAFFFKQWGAFNENGKRVGKKKAGALLDGIEHRGLPVAFSQEQEEGEANV